MERFRVPHAEDAAMWWERPVTEVLAVGEAPAAPVASSGDKAQAGPLPCQGRRRLGIRKDGPGTALA